MAPRPSVYHKIKANVPPGIEAMYSFTNQKPSFGFMKGSVLVLTFLCYTMYHASRKPPSIVKSVLKGDGPVFAELSNSSRLLLDVSTATAASGAEMQRIVGSAGWAPFNGPNGQTLLGEVDLAFLGAYSIGMFFAGHIGDRMDLRIFLTCGMIGSGIFCSLFGMGYFWDNHMLSFYIVLSMVHGLFQSTGWPSVVSIVANWFGKGKRGLIMGIWNAHTSVGNILGTAIAASALASGWGWSFIIPGFLMIAVGILVFAFLTVEPSDVGLPSPYQLTRTASQEELLPSKTEEPAASIKFMDAWRIPGVSAFAFCLFFSKLIAYTFLYWLPYYIKDTPIEGTLLTSKEAGDLSILFDVGGVAGGVLAGHLSDKTGASATVATSFTLLCIPCLWLYRVFGHTSFSTNIALMMLSGFFVNGPYALITTAVSADLGTHESLQGNSKALATVSAIIDGMGSFGGALGPMATGYISQMGGFDNVFNMLYLSALMAALLLLKLVQKELHVMSGMR